MKFPTSRLVLVAVLVAIIGCQIVQAETIGIHGSDPVVFEESWQFWAGWGAIGLGSFLIDQPLHDFSQKGRLHGATAENVFSVFEKFGKSEPYLGAAGILAVDGLIFHHPKSIRVIRDIAISAFECNVISGVVKKAMGRKRPGSATSPGKFFSGGDSFISGHTISAFTLATVLAKYYPEQDLDAIGINEPKPLIPVLCYSIAGLVAVERIYDNHHWASDVVFGAMAGYYSGSLAIWTGEKLTRKKIAFLPGNPATLAYRW